jgi:hypothetical protein
MSRQVIGICVYHSGRRARSKIENPNFEKNQNRKISKSKNSKKFQNRKSPKLGIFQIERKFRTPKDWLKSSMETDSLNRPRALSTLDEPKQVPPVRPASDMTRQFIVPPLYISIYSPSSSSACCQLTLGQLTQDRLHLMGVFV